MSSSHKAEHVAEFIHTVQKNTAWCQAEIARWFGVSQSTVSKWLSGDLVPTDQDLDRLRFLVRVTSEKALLLGAGMLATVQQWYFLCARAPSYPGVQKSVAEKTLTDLLGAVEASARRRQKWDGLRGFGFLCSAVAFAVPFPDNARAFIFGDDPDMPRRYVILVNAALKPHEQAAEVAAELSAHVRPHLVAPDGDIRAKGRLI